MRIQLRRAAAAALAGVAMLIPAAPIAIALPDTDADGLEDSREQRATFTDPKHSAPITTVSAMDAR